MIRKHLLVFIRFIEISWKTSLEYLDDLIIMILDFAVVIVLSIVFWTSIFSNISNIADWTLAELTVIPIFSSAVFSLSESVAGSWQLPEKIVNGSLDKYMCKPINALFASVMEGMQFDEIIKGIVTFVLFIVYYFLRYQVTFSVIGFLSAFGGIIAGTVILILFRVSISLLTFWLGNTRSIGDIIHLENLGLEKYPLQIYSHPLQLFFSTVLPVGVIGCIPAMLMFGKFFSRGSILVFEMILIAIYSTICYLLWHFGIRKYESSGG